MNNAPLPRAWLIVGVLWVVAALNYLDRIMITTMRDSLTQAVPMTDAQFGLLTSVFLWVYGLLSPLAGFLADRFNRSRLIVLSLLIWSLLTWLTGHARNFEELLVVRALMGLSEAAYLPAALALIADYHRGDTRSLATGVHMTGLSVGTGLAGIGGWLAEKQGWRFAFDVFGWLGVAYAVVLWFVLRDPANPSGPLTMRGPEAHPAVQDAPLPPPSSCVWVMRCAAFSPADRSGFCSSSGVCWRSRDGPWPAGCRRISRNSSSSTRARRASPPPAILPWRC
jgi:predicted MFS family arabinose efflux permease